MPRTSVNPKARATRYLSATSPQRTMKDPKKGDIVIVEGTGKRGEVIHVSVDKLLYSVEVDGTARTFNRNEIQLEGA